MFSDPIKNVEQLSLRLGSVVLDLGSGSGHYAIASAKAVGEKGAVYAIDIQKDMLTKLKREAGIQGFHNIEIVWGDIEKSGGTKLKDSIGDYAIISNLMFQVIDKDSVAKESFRILKSGGKLLVVDWSDAFGGLGPHVDSVFSKDAAAALFTKTGFTIEKDIQAGSHHYGMIFLRP